jgi:hypothetical protein
MNLFWPPTQSTSNISLRQTFILLCHKLSQNELVDTISQPCSKIAKGRFTYFATL